MYIRIGLRIKSASLGCQSSCNWNVCIGINGQTYNQAATSGNETHTCAHQTHQTSQQWQILRHRNLWSHRKLHVSHRRKCALKAKQCPRTKVSGNFWRWVGQRTRYKQAVTLILTALHETIYGTAHISITQHMPPAVKHGHSGGRPSGRHSGKTSSRWLCCLSTLEWNCLAQHEHALRYYCTFPRKVIKHANMLCHPAFCRVIMQRAAGNSKAMHLGERYSARLAEPSLKTQLTITLISQMFEAQKKNTKKPMVLQ